MFAREKLKDVLITALLLLGTLLAICVPIAYNVPPPFGVMFMLLSVCLSGWALYKTWKTPWGTDVSD